MAYERIGYTHALCWGRPDESEPHLEKAFQLSIRLTEKDSLSASAWYAVANGTTRGPSSRTAGSSPAALWRSVPVGGWAACSKARGR